jgi:hypothetical protein
MYKHSKSEEKRMKFSMMQRIQNRYLIAPKGLEVLGIVRMGMAFGILAVSEDGTYMRVNGSNIVPLDPINVRNAMRRCGIKNEPNKPLQNDAVISRNTVVQFKKKRVLPANETSIKTGSLLTLSISCKNKVEINNAKKELIKGAN